MDEIYLGVDLGATKLRIGEVDLEGNVICSERFPSDCTDQMHAKDCIMRALDDYLARRDGSERELSAMGVGVIGRADWRSGEWLGIDSHRNVLIPLAEMLSVRYGLPCRIDNDVRSATQAEMRFGYGQEFANLVYINIGTGIAAGTVVNGRVLRGGHLNAGEVGHTTVGVNVGTVCGCGRTNCVETIASGSGIDTCARLFASKYPHTALSIPPLGAGKVAAQEVYQKADTDALCELLVENAAEALANLIMNMVRMSDTQIVVLGGGMVMDGFLYPRILSRLTKATMRFVTGGVVLSKLDPGLVGLIGAATIAMP